jgi:hypothetical protein
MNNNWAKIEHYEEYPDFGNLEILPDEDGVAVTGISGGIVMEQFIGLDGVTKELTIVMNGNVIVNIDGEELKMWNNAKNIITHGVLAVHNTRNKELAAEKEDTGE